MSEDRSNEEKDRSDEEIEAMFSAAWFAKYFSKYWAYGENLGEVEVAAS